MRCGIPLLLLPVLLAAPERASALAEEDSLGWTCGAHILLHGGGSADYAEGGWAADSAAFEARGLVFLRRSESRLEALVAARHDDDSMRVMLREAEAFLRWPGTPWIGAGGFAGRRAPFEPAFGEPLLEHGFQSPDSLRGIYVSSGGVLGFEMEAGFGKAEEDRDLETLVVDAPWLGFGTFSYGRTEISEPVGLDLRVLTAMADFRFLRPHVVYFTAESGDGTGSAPHGLLCEIRGLRLLRSRQGQLELLPSYSYSSDTCDFLPEGHSLRDGASRADLRLHWSSRRYLVGARLGGWMDLAETERHGALAGLDLVSEAGICYGFDARWSEPGSCYAVDVGATYIRRGAEAGGTVSFFPDSVRLMACAGYSPRRDASVRLEVSADAETDMDPAAALCASVWLDRATAVLRLDWIDGMTSISFGGTGWF